MSAALTPADASMAKPAGGLGTSDMNDSARKLPSGRNGKACGRAWYFRRFGTATADDVRDVVWQSLREGFVLSTEHMDHLAGGRNQFTFSWE